MVCSSVDFDKLVALVGADRCGGDKSSNFRVIVSVEKVVQVINIHSVRVAVSGGELEANDIRTAGDEAWLIARDIISSRGW